MNQICRERWGSYGYPAGWDSSRVVTLAPAPPAPAIDNSSVTEAERHDAISRARAFFYHHGRGCLLFLRDGMAADEDRYSSIDEIKEALAEEPDAAALVAAAVWAVGTYDPLTQAVVVQSIDDVIRALIVSPENVEDVGGIEFSATPTH